MESALKYNSLIETYKSFFDYNDDACYALDLNGNFVLFNDAAVALSGYSKQEALQKSIFSLFTTECYEKNLESLHKLTQGKQDKIITNFIHKNGHKVEIYLASFPIYSNGEVHGIVGIARDITEKNKMEAILSRQNHVLEMIAKGSPFKEVLDCIIGTVEEHSPGKCSILLVDEDKRSLSLGSAPNLPIEYRESLKSVPIAPNSGSCGSAAYYKRLVIVSDIANNPLWTNYKYIALKHDLRACWSAPVCDTQQGLLAVFANYYDEVRTPTESEKQLFEKAIYLTSLAIQHYYAQERINFMAFHDDLTGLPNRRLFNDKVNIAIKLYKKDQRKMFGVMYFDLDRFKRINESFGQNLGDMLLKEVALRLQDCLKGNDTVYRWGGDEFVIFLDDISKKEVDLIAKKILATLAKPFLIEGQELYITPGIGISLFPPDGDSPDELLRKADAAMYQAKKEGRNNFQFFNPLLDKKTREKLHLENQLRKALIKEQFYLHYQPIMDLSTNELSAVEALIRWNHPKLGNIPPDRFIPIAEETGMILAIGEWVLKTACWQMKEWQDMGLPVSTISVNISIRQFYQPNLVTVIAEILKETGLDPRCLTIEITESMTMDVEAAKVILYDLKELGVNISIDDFGTGYSSFSYLRKFPIDHLKIDKTFIRDIAKSKEDENIATSILLMAQKLGLIVIAEGVETNEQLGVLRENQCNKAQGYLFSKPIASEDLMVLLSNLSEESK